MKRKLLLEFDLAQAEAVAVAAYCGDEGMKRLFGPCFASNGPNPEKIDCHLDRAIMILDVLGEHYEYKEFKAMYVDNHPRPKQMRQAAKAVGVHATNYDVGSRTVITSLRHHDVFLSTKQEAQLRFNTHQRFPGIKLYQSGVQRELNKTRILKTAKGMKRYFFSKLDSNTYRRAYAFLPQCTVAEITNDGIVENDIKGCKQVETSKMYHNLYNTGNMTQKVYKIWQDGKKYEGVTLLDFNARTLLQVHDSALVESPERYIEDVYKMVMYNLTQPLEVFPFFGESDIMTIQVDCKVGSHWGELKEWQN